MSRPKTWTDANEDLLRRMWNEEKLPASACAKVLGITRNAVIGKVHRMDLTKRGSPLQQRLAAEVKAKRRAAAQRRYREKHPAPARSVYPHKSNLPAIAPKREVKRPVVVSLPMRPGNDAALISGWLAQNGGARRFERGATGDPTMMAIWLRERGYKITLSIAKSRPIKVVDPKGRHFNMSLRRLQELVDDVRQAEGLTPVLLESAA